MSNRKIKREGLASKGFRIASPQTSEENADQKCPLFSFEYLQSSYCISNCTPDEKAGFVEKMRLLSQLTWAQIKCLDKHKLGYEIIAQKQIKAGIPTCVTAEVNLIAFRFCALAPMVGYRDRRVFHVLWFDRDFTLYPH